MPEPLDPIRCCPVCGHEFDEVQIVYFCPTEHYGPEDWIFMLDELIGEWDDYAWVE